MLPLFMVFVGSLVRLIPHLPNFTPLTAIAIFAGANLNKRYALFISLGALALSDYLLLYINPYNHPMMNFSQIHPISEMFHATTLYVWGSFLISGLLGLLIRNRQNYRFIVGVSLFASVQFFLITNFGVWAAGYYKPGLNGLIDSYIMGLPFFKWTILGDLFYTVTIFGLYQLALKIEAKKMLKILDSHL